MRERERETGKAHPVGRTSTQLGTQSTTGCMLLVDLPNTMKALLVVEALEDGAVGDLVSAS